MRYAPALHGPERDGRTRQALAPGGRWATTPCSITNAVPPLRAEKRTAIPRFGGTAVALASKWRTVAMAMVDPKRFRVGTSGWSYPDWRPRFYPEKLAKTKWLAYY